MRMAATSARGAAWWLKLSASWCIILGTLGGFGYAAYVVYTEPPSPVDECRSGTRIAESVIVVVDASDAATDIDQRRVTATLVEERDRALPGTRLSILALNAAAPEAPVELVSVCSPGRVGDSNPLFETASRVEAEWADAFLAPIDRAIRQLGALPVSDSTELFRLLRSLPTRPDFDGRIARRRLVLVSDLLEHAPGTYSQLKGGDFWKGFRQSRLAAVPLPALQGVDVRIDYLQRPRYAAIQGDAHRLFWQELLRAAGARDVSFVGLPAPVATPVTAHTENTPAKPRKKKRKGTKP